MSTATQISKPEALALMARVSMAHVSVSRGALPAVIPAQIRVTSAGDVEILITHPSVVRGADRGDIAAVQVDAGQTDDGQQLSVTATGPLTLLEGVPALRHEHLIVSIDCLDSPYGDVTDPLLRAQLQSPE